MPNIDQPHASCRDRALSRTRRAMEIEAKLSAFGENKFQGRGTRIAGAAPIKRSSFNQTRTYFLFFLRALRMIFLACFCALLPALFANCQFTSALTNLAPYLASRPVITLPTSDPGKA